MKTIDLNGDFGEAFGNYAMPNDILLMDLVSSVNIACGFHAGDYSVMAETVKLAINRGLALGAHPGLPDLQGFGRREMKISASEAYQLTLYQIGALQAFVQVAGGRLGHVKPHGALYNMAAREANLAQGIVAAIFDFDPKLCLYAPANSELAKAALASGLVLIEEAFADRRYQDNASLTPRSDPRGVITDETESLEQVLSIVDRGVVTTTNANQISLNAKTICLHGDGAHALSFAKKIREQLQLKGIQIAPPYLNR